MRSNWSGLTLDGGARNTGGAPIPLRWFPHPFFPYPQPEPDGTTRLCKFNLDSSLEVCTNLLTSLP